MTYITSDIGHHTMSIFLIYDAHSIDSATKRLFSTVSIVKLWSHIFSITPHLLYHWNYEFQYRISFIFVFIFLIFDVDLQLIPLRVVFFLLTFKLIDFKLSRFCMLKLKSVIKYIFLKHLICIGFSKLVYPNKNIITHI